MILACVIYVMIGLLIGKGLFIYSIWGRVPTGFRFPIIWVAFMILGQLWLPVGLYIIYTSRRRQL